MKASLILSAGLSLLLTVPAFAHPGGGLKQLDANGDGQITLQEAQAQAAKHFDAVDANHDGQISQTERAQMFAARQAKRQAQGKGQGKGQAKMQGKRQGKQGFKGPDANGDGVLTRSEALAAAQQRFQRMDTDKNGVVSATELQQLQQKRMQRMQKRQSQQKQVS